MVFLILTTFLPLVAADEETYLYPNGIDLETSDEVILVKQDLKFDLNLVLKLPNTSSLVPKRSEWCDFQESDVQLLQKSTADFDVKLKELFHQFMTTAEGPEHLKEFSEDIRSPQNSQSSYFLETVVRFNISTTTGHCPDGRKANLGRKLSGPKVFLIKQINELTHLVLQ